METRASTMMRKCQPSYKLPLVINEPRGERLLWKYGNPLSFTAALPNFVRSELHRPWQIAFSGQWPSRGTVVASGACPWMHFFLQGERSRFTMKRPLRQGV